MRLLLLHGPAIRASRIKLQELRGKFSSDNVMVFEEGEELRTILTNLQSLSLFEGERLVIVENPPDLQLSAVSCQLSATLVLWFDHEVDTKKWPGFTPFFFPESKEVSIFPFLDLLAEGKSNAFLEAKKLNNAGFDIFYLITMVYYLLRNLVSTPKNAPDFVKKKLTKQRTKFAIDGIKALYKEILEIEFKLKSGLLEKPQAEFLLVNKFTGIPGI